jgi:ketosteroid isomerase-like protein
MWKFYYPLKPDDPIDDAAAISEAIREFALAFNEGNLDTLMAVFSKDLVSMEHGHRTVVGKEALEKWRSHVQDLFTKYNPHLEITTDEIRVSGKMGFERGSLKVALNPKSGGEVKTEEHRFLDVWEKRNDQWKIVQAMSNKSHLLCN